MAEGNGQQIEWLDEIVKRIEQLHDEILRTSGGMSGVHPSSLSAACARPFQSAFGEFVYKTPYEKAAALFHAIVRDHPFVDGNKRTATLAALAMLRAHRILTPINPPTRLQVRMLGEVALETASAGLTVEQVTFWLHRIFDPA